MNKLLLMIVSLLMMTNAFAWSLKDCSWSNDLYSIEVVLTSCQMLDQGQAKSCYQSILKDKKQNKEILGDVSLFPDVSIEGYCREKSKLKLKEGQRELARWDLGDKDRFQIILQCEKSKKRQLIFLQEGKFLKQCLISSD